MAFMRPEVVGKEEWAGVETTAGFWWVPFSVLTTAETESARSGDFEPLLKYTEGNKVYNDQSSIKTGYGVRLSAPGYMDSTEWEVYGSKKEALRRARELEREAEGEDYATKKRAHAIKKSPAQLQREIDEVLANPGSASGAFDPPRTMNVVDRHGGFTAVTRSGTLWRPGKAAPGGTVGTLVPGSVKRDDFYQNKQPVVSALYKLPSYSYKVKVWWEPSGARIA